MLCPPLVNESKIPLVKMKIVRQLHVIGFCNVTTVILFLLSGQKINGHIGLPAWRSFINNPETVRNIIKYRTHKIGIINVSVKSIFYYNRHHLSDI